MRRSPLLLVLLTVLAAGLALPGSASAARDAEVSMMDDVLLLGKSQSHIDRQLDIFVRLGVDRLRLSVLWEGAAPRPSRRTKPGGFDGANHLDGRYRWAAVDRIVRSATQRGLRIMLTVTGPGPRWGMTGSKRNRVWRPSPDEYGDFAEAVARRYGAFVDHYGVWNEPNQNAWLQPQSSRSRLIAPHIYRDLVHAAYRRIKQADANSTILVGNLAPGGTRRRGRRANIRPLTFLRAFGCVTRSYRRSSRGACGDFEPIPADAVGHHPYQFFTSPFRRDRTPDEVHISNGRSLLRALDRLQNRRRLAPGRGKLDVYYTEFGYQTFPPDPFAGVKLRQQNRWLQEAAYVVWKTPRIRGLNQFRLTDGPIRGTGFAAFREFQTGLLFSNRKKKPAYRSFPDPFVIRGTRFWGQVRPGGAHSVAIQRKPLSGGSYSTVRTVQTDANGYFSVRLTRRAGKWRYRYDGGKSDVITLR